MNKDHNFKEVYSFVMGDEYSLHGFWHIYRCDVCRVLKLVSSEQI
jgi:hypothetical protein